MKQKIFMVLLFCIVVFLNSCNTLRELVADSPEVKISENFDSTNVAVFSFETIGRFKQNRIGLIAADNFSNKLYINGKYNVIDRAYVNDLFVKKNIRGTLNFNEAEFGRLGSELRADYIVLGKIIKTEDQFFFDDNHQSTYWVEIRIINTKTNTIAAVVQCKDEFELNEIEAISILINRIVTEL